MRSSGSCLASCSARTEFRMGSTPSPSPSQTPSPSPSPPRLGVRSIWCDIDQVWATSAMSDAFLSFVGDAGHFCYKTGKFTAKLAKLGTSFTRRSELGRCWRDADIV